MLSWREVWSYVRLLLRWWFVLAIAVGLSAGTAWYLLREQPDFYVAQTSLMVGDNFRTNAPSSVAVDLSNVLAAYYEVLLRREVILQPVVERLNLSFPWEVIRDSMLSTNINRQANLLEIKIVDSNPERAAALANGIAEQLISYSPNSPEKLAAQRNEVERQIGETQALLADVDRRIEELEEQQASLDSAIDIRDIADQLERLEAQRERYQGTYNELVSLRGSTTANSLTIFERAAVPQSPLPQKPLVILGIASLGGLLLAICAVLLLDRLDTRWRTGADLEEWLGLANLGAMSYGMPVAMAAASPTTMQRARALRETYTSIVLQARNALPRMLLVSSPKPSELRSAYVIDLAHLYACSGHRVLLVDAELTQPHMTRMLLEDQREDQGQPEDAHNAIELWGGGPSRAFNIPSELWVRLRNTPLMNVVLLPSQHSGHDNLPVLVPSLHWPELIRSLRQSADVVIFNGPSLLTGADAALIAPEMDGVVLVVNPTTDTRRQIVESRARLLNHQGTRLLGAVTVTKAAPPEAPARAKAGTAPRLGIAIDRGGITISLPSRKRREKAGQPEVRVAAGEAALYAVSTADGAARRETQVERPSTTWEELAARARAGTAPLQERHVGEQQATPRAPLQERHVGEQQATPRAPLVTPLVIVTPPPSDNGPEGNRGPAQDARPSGRRSGVVARRRTRRR